MKYAIITGASKGIGEGLALTFKEKGYTIISLARSSSDNLSPEEQIACDLLNIEATEAKLKFLLTDFTSKSATEIVLINNAGTLGDVDRLENHNSATIEQAFKLNVTVPVTLSSLFIKELLNFNIQKTIINISSGAAVSPYYGWSVYCASKSAIDMFTKVTAIEQETAKYPVRVLSIYPGIVDTEMQTVIRSRNEEQFAPVDKFIESKEKGWLSSPKDAGTSVFELFNDKSLAGGSIVDVRTD